MHLSRILIVAAHPDDDILGCGGTISALAGKAKIRVIFIAEGSSCRFDDHNSIQSKSVIKERNLMAINALELLGVTSYSFYNYPCGRLDQVPLIEINKVIEKEIKEFKPDTIFTHSNIDSNQDHVKINQAALIAARPGLSSVKNIYAYEILSSTEWGFQDVFKPNLFVPLTELDVRAKVNAMLCYKSEFKDFPFPRSEKGIFYLASLRGMQSGYQFAEAYNVIRSTLYP